MGSVGWEKREQDGEGTLTTQFADFTVWLRKGKTPHMNSAKTLAEFREKRFIKYNLKSKANSCQCCHLKLSFTCKESTEIA